jgi:hypothetical protein
MIARNQEQIFNYRKLSSRHQPQKKGEKSTITTQPNLLRGFTCTWKINKRKSTRFNKSERKILKKKLKKK